MSQVRLIALTQPLLKETRTAEELIAYCARVSNAENQNNHGTASRLFKYLIRHAHWSPFEMAHAVMEIETTRDVARQILRHRSFSFQEFSQRYAEVEADGVSRETRMQDPENRQGSILTDDKYLISWWHSAQQEQWAESIAMYDKALQRGIAKEVARAILPEGLTRSRLYMSGTIRSWIHYIKLRSGSETQKEHRQIAMQCYEELIKSIPSLKELVDDPPDSQKLDGAEA